MFLFLFCCDDYTYPGLLFETKGLMCSFMLLEIKARVDAMWEQMNKGVPNKTRSNFLHKPGSTVNKKSKNSSTVRNLLFSLFLMELI